MDMKKPPKEGGWKLKGGQRGSRTLDTRIFSPLLYQLSYLAVYVVLTCSSITISNLKRESNENFKKVWSGCVWRLWRAAPHPHPSNN